MSPSSGANTCSAGRPGGSGVGDGVGVGRRVAAGVTVGRGAGVATGLAVGNGGATAVGNGVAVGGNTVGDAPGRGTAVTHPIRKAIKPANSNAAAVNPGRLTGP